jgi:hypothetical protein
MSDFDDVVYVETDDKPVGPGVAPSGDYPAKVIAAEKYKSQQGNWTLKMTFQIAGGNYRDHNEWYNLWDPREDIKQISTDIFTRLSKAVGFVKQPPSSAQDYVGKSLTLTLKEVENNWTDNEGNERTGSKNKVLRYLPADDGGMSPPPEVIPPNLG